MFPLPRLKPVDGRDQREEKGEFDDVHGPDPEEPRPLSVVVRFPAPFSGVSRMRKRQQEATFHRLWGAIVVPAGNDGVGGEMEGTGRSRILPC